MQLTYKQSHLYINVYTKKQHVFLLRNDNLSSIYTFQIQNEFLKLLKIFLKFLNYLNHYILCNISQYNYEL